MKNITAILPAYNEEIAIGSVVLGIKKHVNRVIVINDGSTDNTAEIAEIAGAEVINYSTNSGGKLSLKEGIEAAADSDIIVTMNIALCHDPNLVQEMTSPLKMNEYDLVVGTCFQKAPQDKESVYLLNNKNVTSKPLGFMACSKQCLKKIDLTHVYTLSAHSIQSLSEKNDLKTKYIKLEDKPTFDLLNHVKIGIVVPAYNEELLIEETIDGMPEYVDKIYIIDDCSTDRTPEIIKEMKDPRIVSLRHEVNKGVGAGIINGYKMSLEDRMDIVAVMAGDNQMDPKQLPRLLIPIIEGKADYTKGNRLLSKQHRTGMSKWRSFGNGVLSMLTKIGSGYWQIMDPQNGYCAISRQALEALDLDEVYPYYGYCNDLLVKLNAFGMKVTDVVMPARYGRETSSIKYSRYMLKVAPMLFRGFLWRLKMKYMVLDFHPLVMFYIASMILIPSGVIFGMWIIIQKILQNPVSPNFPLLNVFITLMGVQLLLFAMFFDMQAEKRGSTTA